MINEYSFVFLNIWKYYHSLIEKVELNLKIFLGYEKKKESQIKI